MVPADEGVDLAGQRHGVQIVGKRFQRGGGFLFGFLLLASGFAFAARQGFLGRLGDAVGDEVDHVQAGHALLGQEVQGMGILLAENGHQHVGAGDFLLAGGLDMQDGTLDHALKAQSGLGIHLGFTSDPGRMALDEIGQLLAQIIDVGRASAQHFRRRGVVQHGEEEMFDRDEFVALLPSLHEGHVQTDFQLLGNHLLSSITHCNGCWCSRAWDTT